MAKRRRGAVATHSLKKKIIVSDNQKSATGESPCSADFVLGPVKLDHKEFISALDRCSNRYPLVGGTRQRHFDGTSLSHENCLKTRRLPPVGCTLCWAAL